MKSTSRRAGGANLPDLKRDSLCTSDAAKQKMYPVWPEFLSYLIFKFFKFLGETRNLIYRIHKF